MKTLDGKDLEPRGGPDFNGPRPQPRSIDPQVMDLRDRFALAVLQGMSTHYGVDTQVPIQDHVTFAYQVADAMMAARRGQNDQATTSTK